MTCLIQEFCWAHLQHLRLTRTQLDPPASWGTQTAPWVWGEVLGTNYLHKQGTALKHLQIVTAREIWNFKKPDTALALWQPCFGELWKIHQKKCKPAASRFKLLPSFPWKEGLLLSSRAEKETVTFHLKPFHRATISFSLTMLWRTHIGAWFRRDAVLWNNSLSAPLN